MNILVSYYFAQREPDRWDTLLRAAQAVGWRVLIDSGAFSAYTQREVIDLDAYCRFLERRMPWLWDCVMLDVVGDGATSARNLRAMVERGLRPMAVLTDDQQPDVAAQLVEDAGNKRLCVAGATHWSSAPLLARLELVRRMAPDAEVHALGLTRGNLAWRAPVATVDSSTWMAGVRFGKFSTFDRHAGCLQHDYRKVRATPFHSMDRRVRQVMLASGIRPSDLSKPEFSRGGFSALNLLTVEAWLQFAETAHQHGRRFFFATTQLQQLIVLAAACRNRVAGGGVRWPDARIDALQIQQVFKEDRARFVDLIVSECPWPQQ